MFEREGGVGVHKKPRNLTNSKIKPKTASKIREDVYVVEIVEARRIFSEEKPENTKPHRTANPKTQSYFCRKPRAK